MQPSQILAIGPVPKSPPPKGAGPLASQIPPPVSQLSSDHDVHPSLMQPWEWQLLEDGSRAFAGKGEHSQREQEAQEAELYEQIGRLKMESEWQKKGIIYESRQEFSMVLGKLS